MKITVVADFESHSEYTEPIIKLLSKKHAVRKVDVKEGVVRSDARLVPDFFVYFYAKNNDLDRWGMEFLLSNKKNSTILMTVPIDPLPTKDADAPYWLYCYPIICEPLSHQKVTAKTFFEIAKKIRQ